MPFQPVTADDINTKLRTIESQHQVRVLFACESGSRSWGFASPESDYDIRFIFVRRTEDYLAVFPPRDTIECPVTDVWDLAGWDLKKALTLMTKGNSSLLEWLTSPVLYQNRDGFREALLALYKACVPPEKLAVGYRAMATNNARAYLTGISVCVKKYLYVIRPLIAAHRIEKEHAFAPSAMAALIDWAAADNPAMANEVRHLVARKKAGDALTKETRLPAVDAYIAERLAAPLPVIPTVPFSPDAVNRFFRRWVQLTSH